MVNNWQRDSIEGTNTCLGHAVDLEVKQTGLRPRMARIHDGTRLRPSVNDETNRRPSSKNGVGPQNIFGRERGDIGRGGFVEGGKGRMGCDRADKGVNILDGRVGCRKERGRSGRSGPTLRRRDSGRD